MQFHSVLPVGYERRARQLIRAAPGAASGGVQRAAVFHMPADLDSLAGDQPTLIDGISALHDEVVIVRDPETGAEAVPM